MGLYRKTAFGPLLDIDLVFNGQLLHHFLLGRLWPTRETIERGISGESLRELILGPKDPNKKKSSCKDVKTAFKKFNFNNDEDAVKVVLALFIETVMIGKDKKTQFNVNVFGIVNDLEVFVHYKWPSLFYKRTLNSMKTIMHGKKEDSNNIRTHHEDRDNNEEISHDDSNDDVEGPIVNEHPVHQTAEEIHELPTQAFNLRGHFDSDSAQSALMKPGGIASKIRSEGFEMEDGNVAEYKPTWTDVDFVFRPINIKQHWLMLAIDLERCTIFVFDSMPNYIGSDIVDSYLQLVVRAIPSMLIPIQFDIQHKRLKYGQWEVKRSKVTLQEGMSLDCGVFCAKFMEYCVTSIDKASLTQTNMALYRKQYVAQL
ncbi:uncharacterized protein LOC120067442 [Benincasa hispida]|uniref:uncharacterized protein LOC120067442 n=1 Tax=Benincasa hispida TaxID=102211 RepID=UPI001900B041|nr:uncharacterized protein LOC120067442 [Benincasa hispida]